jgi:hypothetical protein
MLQKLIIARDNLTKIINIWVLKKICIVVLYTFIFLYHYVVYEFNKYVDANKIIIKNNDIPILDRVLILFTFIISCIITIPFAYWFYKNKHPQTNELENIKKQIVELNEYAKIIYLTKKYKPEEIDENTF